MAQASVRLDRLQKGLFEAFSGVAPNVLWADQEVPHSALPAGDLLELSLTSGPHPRTRNHARGSVLLPADSAVVRVTNATAGTMNVARLNGFSYRREAVAGDSVSDIRDDLLADMVAGEAGEPLTIAADSTDGISLTGTSLGALRRLELIGELAADSVVFSGDAVLETIGTGLCLVTVQAFSKNREIRSGAPWVINHALDRLQATDVVETLGDYGIAVWGLAGPTNLNAITAGHWETRQAFDVTIAMRSHRVSPVAWIDSASATIAIQGHGSFTATAARGPGFSSGFSAGFRI